MRRLAPFVLPLAVFLAGLGLGAALHGLRGTADLPVTSAPQQVEKADGTAVAGAAKKRAFSPDEEMLTAIMSAVAEDEPLLRAHRLHDRLARLSAAELAALFDRTVGVEDRERRGAVLNALLARWAALDPAGAAAAVRPFRDRFRATARSDWNSVETAVSIAWTQAQPEAELAEAMATPDAPWAQTTAWNALESLANGDREQKLKLLAQLPASQMRNAMCMNEIRGLAEKDTAAAEASLELLPEPRQRARVRAEILGKLAERDPAAALVRLAALAPDLAAGTEGERLVSTVLRAAAKKDPAAALAALDDVPEALRTQATGAVLVGWAGEHPVEALDWAAKNSVDLAESKAVEFYGSDGFGGWNSLLSTAFDSDFSKTLSWLTAQPTSHERDRRLNEGIWRGTTEQRLDLYAALTPQGRNDAANAVMQVLYESDPQRAETWAKALPRGTGRENALSSLVTYQARNAPERLDALVAAWPAGADRDAALRGINWSLYGEPQRALEYTRRISDPTMREQMLERAAQTWAYRDEPAARAWVARAPELSAEQKRVLLRQFDER